MTGKAGMVVMAEWAVMVSRVAIGEEQSSGARKKEEKCEKGQTKTHLFWAAQSNKPKPNQPTNQPTNQLSRSARNRDQPLYIYRQQK